jgi:hypothetical protein
MIVHSGVNLYNTAIFLAREAKNPTTASYNAKSSLVSFEIKNIFFYILPSPSDDGSA